MKKLYEANQTLMVAAWFVVWIASGLLMGTTPIGSALPEKVKQIAATFWVAWLLIGGLYMILQGNHSHKAWERRQQLQAEQEWLETKAAAKAYDGQELTILYRQIVGDGYWRSLHLIVQSESGKREEWNISRTLGAYRQVRYAVAGDKILAGFSELAMPTDVRNAASRNDKLAFLNLKLFPAS